MLVIKEGTEELLWVGCPKCGSRDTVFYKFNKSRKLTSKSKIKCNECNLIHRLGECKFTEVETK